MITLPTSAAAGRAAPSLEPGVPLALAQWRARHYRDVRYALRLGLPAGGERLSGELALEVTLPARPVDLVLDWRGAPVGELRVNGRPAAARAVNEHLVVAAGELKPGRNRIALAFSSPVAVSGTPVTRYRDREDGAGYLYSLLVPADASALFPCFDQPDLKARFSLELDLPEGWTAISNAPVADRKSSITRFKTTRPISTYLFAFAAGPFEALGGDDGAGRLYVRRSQLARAREHAGEVIRLERESRAFFARYFARRFPFPKHDLVLLPEFPYGGMEHAGATFLNEERVLFPAPPSAADRLARAQLVFHETSHQWFGNLVTMRWFDDLWLKEGFANFMAAKATAALAPEFDAWTAFHRLKLAAVRTDATRGTTPIRQPLANLDAAKTAYGAIVYSKGPAVLRQAEFYLGEAAFRKAVRQFLKSHAWGAADWRDLVRAFEQASGRRLGRWAAAWVERAGQPTVRARWTFDRQGRLAELAIEQHDALGEGHLWPMRLRVLARGLGAERTEEVLLERRARRVSALEGFPGPALVYANAGDFGYGRFLLDPYSLETVLEDAFESGTTLLGAQLAEAVWEAVRDAELAPARFIEFALRELGRTGDDIAAAGLLARIEAAFRRYLDDAQRDALAPRLERALLAEGALGAAPPGRRLLLLRAFLALAWSPEALAELRRLLDGERRVPGIALASRDRFRAIERLLARGDPEALARLGAQAAADRSDDGRRYAYAAGAADRASKRALFDAFAADRTLPESWIEAALGPLNAPEQAAATRPLLRAALARLPALARERRIFFVEHWLGAFIGGQWSPEALEEVRAFLREAALEPGLERKLLEAADGLERAVRIRARYPGPGR